MTTEQSKALLDTEQSQPDLVLVFVIKGNARVKSDAVIAHLDVNDVIWIEREVDIDPIDMGVLDRVEQQLADRFKEQEAHIVCLGVGQGGSRYTHDDAVLLLGTFC